MNLFPLWTIGLPIYKRKKKHPRKKTRTFTRKHAKKNLTRKHAKKNRTRNLPRKQELVQENRHENTHSFLLCQFFFSWPLSCRSACFRACFLARFFFLRGRFLAYEFLFPCFRVCFMHESFFAWMLSCTIYFFCVFSLFLVITCHYLAGVKEKLLDDEDHEALMDPSIIKQHSKFIVKLLRSYFGGH